jgi:1,2-diacylglycerol 3-beta-galactosyltransferase
MSTNNSIHIHTESSRTNRPLRILLLTANAGFGHRSATLAIEEAFKELYGSRTQIFVVNPFDDKRAPILLHDSQADYDKIVRSMPELYRLGYEASDAAIPTIVVESFLTVLLFELMEDIIRQIKPDAIVTTYPLYQAPLSAYFTISRHFIPFMTVVTDLATVHRIWFNEHIDQLFVPTETVKELALDYGISEDTITISGIPVHPRISREKRSKEEIREELGWQKDITTILAVGSKRVDGMMETLDVVNHFGSPLQLAVVAGKDKETYQTLKKIEWHIPAHIYDFVDNMPTLMRASDAIICKAGGLITTESLAAGLPMIFINLIPGQETGNAEYVVSNGAGDMARKPFEVLSLLKHFTMNNNALLKERAFNAQKLGKPYAAYEVARLAFEAAERGPFTRERKILQIRPKLIDLLNQNHIALNKESENK